MSRRRDDAPDESIGTPRSVDLVSRHHATAFETLLLVDSSDAAPATRDEGRTTRSARTHGASGEPLEQQDRAVARPTLSFARQLRATEPTPGHGARADAAGGA